MKNWVAFLLIAIGTGCGKKQEPIPVYLPDSLAAVSIEQLPGDKPALERVYRVRISPQVSLKITMSIFLNSLFKTGELRQADGRWIIFDVDAVADKIIDQKLVPIVQMYVDQIQKTDADWRDSNPREYTDKSGTRWVRQ